MSHLQQKIDPAICQAIVREVDVAHIRELDP